jgi:hypothetical protein
VSTETNVSRAEWADAWPDALAFVAGLALAWFGDWETRDLVWSLWLSSLVVGYAMIGWMIFGAVGVSGKTLAGGVFMLAFFTVHFGGFHFVHSMFLNGFFPVMDGVKEPGLSMYAEVFRRYWMFIVVTAIAERAAFRRFSGADSQPTANLMAPYKNVIRLHVLIFFFAFVSFAKIDNFFVYAVVYAVYFFPWRLLRKQSAEVASV